MNNPFIFTSTGRYFHPLDPILEEIDIEDIAHSLSKICRFQGHVQGDKIYSVAQHSVLVSQNCDPEYSLYGILHDASEAYICDFSSVLKHLPEFEFYRNVEYKLQSMIYRKFGLEPNEPINIKETDLRITATEIRDLISSLHTNRMPTEKPYDFKIEPLMPQEAKELFLNRFKELTGNKYV